MDRNFDTIALKIDEQSSSFLFYLKTFLLDSYSWDLLEKISKQTDVFIFSGVIRNFLIGYYENRDLDIVVKDLDKIKLSYRDNKYISLRKNSFGGYKLQLGKLLVDIWDIKYTWGLHKLSLSSTPDNLIRTAFFNFSAIVFDFNNRNFIYDKEFLNFYVSQAIDVLYGENPNIPLCIVNTFYYSVKYFFSIKFNLCRWIIEHYEKNMNFEYIQKRHFSKIILNNQIVESLIEVCRTFLPVWECEQDRKVLKIIESKDSHDTLKYIVILCSI